MALIVVDDPAPIEAAINALRTGLGRPNYEFKFSRCGHAVRVAFLRAIATQPVAARCRVLDKRHRLDRRRDVLQGLYGQMIGQVLRDAAVDLVHATLVIDESFRSKREQAKLTTSLRRSLGSERDVAPILGDIKYSNSRSDSMLQVADMVVGAVARSFEKGDDTYARLLPERLRRVKEVLP